MSFNTQTTRVRIATDFWIYVALSIPLTLLTVGYWFSVREHQEDVGMLYFGMNRCEMKRCPECDVGGFSVDEKLPYSRDRAFEVN
jgi:hypothetical protein